MIPTEWTVARGRGGAFPPVVDLIDADGDCWLWQGSMLDRGYGRIWVGSKTRVAHRLVWETLVGPIPDGLTLDHLCRVRSCVNPDHLEPVSSRVNVLRGYGPPAVAARRSVCVRGHRYTDDTLYVDPDGFRRCRICNRERKRKREGGRS